MAEVKHFLDKDSIQSDADFLKPILADILKQLQTINATKIQLQGSKSLGDATTQLKQIQAESAKLVDLQLKIAKAETEYAKAKLLSNKADTEGVKKKKEQVDLEVKIAKEKERLIKNAEKEAKKIEDLNNEYVKLQTEQKKAAAESLRLGAALIKSANGNEQLADQLLKTDKAYLDVTKRAKDMNDQLLKIEQNVGRSQRNVGNYASAFSGLNTSFARVAQELPSLNVSFQTFALAISNNLPIVAEEITRAKAAIAQLQAEGKTAPSLFSQITKSLLSFQVGLSIAITLFVTYADEIKDFFTQLFNGKKAIDAIAESQKDLNDINTEAAKSYAKEKVELDALVVVATDSNRTRLEQSAAIKKINDQMPDHLGNLTLENIKTAEGVKILAAYTSELQKKALAQAFITKIQGLYVKLLDAENSGIQDNITLYDKFVSFLKNPSISGVSPGAIAEQFARGAKNRLENIKSINDEIGILTGKFNDALRDGSAILDLFDGNDKKIKDKSADDRKRLLEDELKAQRELAKLRIQNAIDEQQRILENEENGYKTRIEAANKFYDFSTSLLQTELSQQLAEIDRQAAKAGLKGAAAEKATFNQKELAWEQYYKNVADLQRTSESQITGISKFFMDKRERETVEALQKRFEMIQNGSEYELAQIQKTRDEELKALQEKQRLEILSTNPEKRKAQLEKQESDRLAIVRKYIKLELQAQLDKVQALIALETDPLKRAQLEAQAAALRLKIDKELTDEQLKNRDKVIKKEEELAAIQKQLQNEVFTLIKTFTLGRFDVAKNQIQDQIDKTEEQKRKEIEAINATTLSAQEKAARITNLEKKAQADRERLELRQRQIDQQRARFERAFTIAQIVAKTAEAVAKAVAANPLTGGLPFSAIVAAIGAAQIATVLATPIPKFRTGKGAYDKYEGPAWVGDGGKSEMIFREDGSMEKTPATPVMTWVGKNDIIHPDADALLNHTLYKQGQVMNYSVPGNYEFAEMTSTLSSKLGRIEKAIMNKREYYFNINNGKPSVMTKDGTTTKRWLNDNLQFGK